MNDGALARAVYDFVTDVEGELPLLVGDIIQVHHTVDRYWLFGNRAERKGRLPSGFVVEEPLPTFTDGQAIFVASENFATTELGDLGFNKGDVIVGTTQVDQNWWRGESQGRNGIFPVTHVWRADAKLFKKFPSKGQKVNHKARVLIDMTAQLDEEMDLRKGDIITITEIVDADWYRGEFDGKVGIFPSSFVIILDERNVSSDDYQTRQDVPPSSFGDARLSSTQEDEVVYRKVSTSIMSPPSGYHSNNSGGISPYARTIFPFTAQYSDELGFTAGKIVKLVRHIDAQWLEGEIDGRVGFFPKTHVEIIVDCADKKPAVDNGVYPVMSSMQETVELVPGETQARVLYDYTAQTPEDLNLVEDEQITILRKLNSDWYEARDSQKLVGLCPANYVTLLPTKRKSSEYINNNKVLSKVDVLEFTSTNVNNNNYNYVQRHSVHILQQHDKVNNDGASVINSDILSLDPLFDSSTPSACTPQSVHDRRFYQRDDFSKPRSVSDASALEKSIAQNLDTMQSVAPAKLRMPERSSSFSGSYHERKTTSTLPRQPSLYEHHMVTRQRSVSSAVTSTTPRPTEAQDQWRRQRSSSLGSSSHPPPRPPPPVMTTLTEDSTPDLVTLSPPSSAIPPPPMSPPPPPPPPLIPVESSSPPLPTFLPPPPPTFSSRQRTPTPPRQPTPPPSITNSRPSSMRLPCRAAPPPPLSDAQPTAPPPYIAPPPPPFSTQSRRDPGTAVHELQRKITEREKNLKQLKSAKHELESHLATQQSSQPVMQDQVKAYEDTIDGLSTEISSLKDSITQLARRDSVDGDNKSNSSESQNEEAEAQQRAAEYRRKNAEKRRLVIMELLQTERDYLRDMKLCADAFLANPDDGKSRGMDMEIMFGNLNHIIKLAEQLLQNLERASVGKEAPDMIIGPCFQSVSDDMKAVYGHYCSNHDEVIQLLDKYQDNFEIFDFITQKVEVIREKTSCFNLGALLIKPVQRILKYPLLLNELIKCTEDDSPDMIELQKAIHVMTDVATAINEYKRRKDLVVKYRKEPDNSLSNMFSKLSLHSIAKKSNRIGMRLSSSIGLTSVTKDEAFDEEECKFRSLDKTIKTFLKDVTTFCMQLEEWVKGQFCVSEEIASFYVDTRNRPDVDQHRTVQRELYATIWSDFKNSVSKRVVTPLTDVLRTFQGPAKLIEKRHDKLLDYDSSSMRIEKNKDMSKAKLLSEEHQETKRNYEAMNTQLLEELPKLFTLALDVFQDCVGEFLTTRKRFIGRYTKQILPLMELPNMQLARGDVLETFYSQHNQSIAHLATLTFLPKNFFPPPRPAAEAAKEKQQQQQPSSAEKANKKGSLTPVVQSKGDPTKVQSQYPKTSVFCAIRPHQASDDFEVALAIGDVLGVIKKQDPMGSSARWYVDNGTTKGIVPASCLSQMFPNSKTTHHGGGTPSPRPISYPPPSGEMLIPIPAAPVRPITPTTSSLSSLPGVKTGYPDLPSTQLPPPPASSLHVTITRPAPAPPPPAAAIYGNLAYDTVDRRYSTPYQSPTDDVYVTPPDGSVGQRYDDVPYEEADLLGLNTTPPGGTTTWTNGGQSSADGSSPQQVSEFYFGTYEFQASTSSELSLSQGQVVMVVHKQDMDGNPEWWFVQDRYGNQGFMPANRLARWEGT